MEHFDANGIRLHYIKTGSGQPMLFIPGSISDYRTWTNIEKQFANSYECYNISRRYQYPGKYMSGGNSSVDVNTEDIAIFIQEKKLSPAIIIGHSFGGFIGLNLAIKYPELIKCIIAEEPIFAPVIVKNPKNPLEIMRLMFKNAQAGKSFARLGMKGITAAFKALAKNDLITAQQKTIDGLTDGKKTPDTVDALTRQQLIDNMASFAGEDPFNNNIELTNLQKIKCPVLLLNGTESPYIFRYINEELKKKISNCEHICFNNADHWIHIEQANEFTSCITDYLKKQV